MVNLVKRSSVFLIFGLFFHIIPYNARRKRETWKCHTKSTAWSWEVVQPILESPWWVLSPKTNNSKIWDLTLGPPYPLKVSDRDSKVKSPQRKWGKTGKPPLNVDQWILISQMVMKKVQIFLRVRYYEILLLLHGNTVTPAGHLHHQLSN